MKGGRRQEGKHTASAGPQVKIADILKPSRQQLCARCCQLDVPAMLELRMWKGVMNKGVTSAPSVPQGRGPVACTVMGVRSTASNIAVVLWQSLICNESTVQSASTLSETGSNIQPSKAQRHHI